MKYLGNSLSARGHVKVKNNFIKIYYTGGEVTQAGVMTDDVDLV